MLSMFRINLINFSNESIILGDILMLSMASKKNLEITLENVIWLAGHRTNIISKIVNNFRLNSQTEKFKKSQISRYQAIE